jgi:hypothetical protein
MDIDLSELTDDGDTIEIEDGRKLRLRIEVDQDASINDYDSDGKVEWTRRDRDYGRTVRPDDFDGAARIIETDGDSSLWWQPPSPKMIGCVWTPEQMRSEQARITELVRYGFRGVVLELLDGVDAYNRPIVKEVASLWGIDSLENGYLASVLYDLLAELNLDTA